MRQRQINPKRSVNGIILLNKSIGMSSNQALQKAKRLFAARKAGHTGSLDPMATGLLPLCFGEATKFSQYLLDADKTYRVKARLGVRTTTSDAEGEVVSEKPVPEYTVEMLNKTFDAFRGEIEQVPSMFSALKYQGQPLYKLARQGITVDRPARTLQIYQLDVLHYEDNTVEFEVNCSKGTYVRTLVDDFGELLGCGAHVVQLHRTTVGPYTADQMISLEALDAKADNHSALDAHLMPVDSSVQHWPLVTVSSSTGFYLCQGQSVSVSDAPSSGWVRIALKEGPFLGVGEIQADGKVAPRRMVQSN